MGMGYCKNCDNWHDDWKRIGDGIKCKRCNKTIKDQDTIDRVSFGMQRKIRLTENEITKSKEATE